MTHVHLIGIGGSGLSAIARLLLERGYDVSGSDQVLSVWAQDLIALGAKVYIGHQAEQISGADLVIRSSAIPESNIEVRAAREKGIPVLKRHEFLGQLLTEHTGVAVAGTHGKTTTTAMIAFVLTSLGGDPSYIIGGTAKDLGGNAHSGTGPCFVIEADEYDHMFLGLQPDIMVITNLEHDHPDCYPTMEEYQQAFKDFVGNLRDDGTLLVCQEDAGAAALVDIAPPGRTALTYGLSEPANYRAENLAQNNTGGFTFEAWFDLTGKPAQSLGTASLQVPGLHNVRNALATLAVVHQLGLDTERAARLLSGFTGTGRRFDILGEAFGVTVIDDYAHHPTEIRTTLAAARARYPGRRLWAVWQPHTYSRTQMLMDQFITAFDDADKVVVTEIYASREKPVDFSSRTLVAKMSHPDAVYTPTLKDAASWIIAHIHSGDVLLVLSAGDATEISAQVLSDLQEKSA